MKINYDVLKSICLAKIKDFKPFGDTVETPDGVYIYKDNKSKILGVAHLDTVLKLNHFYVNHIENSDYIINAQLDDRLGVYVLTNLLPSMGVKFDLLLTEGEETGRSTAAYFESTKQYNWIFSFDRNGEDVVCYQYHDSKWDDAIKTSGFKLGIGSFSDIAFMDSLGVKGLNIGVGYHGEHSRMCYADTSILKRQVKRFIHFYHKNKDTTFLHDKSMEARSISRPFTYYYQGEATEYNDCFLCHMNRGKHYITDDTWLCNSCFNQAAQCVACEAIYYEDELTDGLCQDCLSASG